MTDEQRASLAKEHLEKASLLIDKLIAAGAEQMESARENLIDVMGLLDDLDFEEGNLAEGQPAVVGAFDEDDEDQDTEEFREDQEEE